MVNKQRLIDEFLELVQIDSPSSKEGKVAQVLVKKLEEIGCEVIIDNAGEKTGGETGNVIATLKGNRSGKKILFSSHMDTVSPSIGVKPIIDEVNGIIKSDGTTVLGSDDKAGIAAILEGLRNIKENNIDHADIQVVFSIWEEGGLHGAKNLDYSKIDAEYAFVLDSGGSPGEIIVKAPAQDAIKVKITGKPAHAGLQPENGVSAIMVASRAIENMKLLRIDEETTANIKNADKEFGAEIEIEVKRAYGPFNIDETDEIVQLAKKAFSNMNIEGKTASTGGGSDTNILNKNGIKSVNLGIGMKKAHTLEEYIAIEDLINSAVMVGEIIKEA